MPKMIISMDGVVIQEIQLSKARTTLGRRPYNDIVIDHLAVSGEHAVLQLTGSQVCLEDLGSTNGTYVNGKAVKKQLLQDGDMVDVGKYRIRFVDDASDDGFAQTMLFKPGSGGLASVLAPAVPATPLAATIRVLSGVAAGRELALTKVVTTIGKPGVAIAAITRRPRGFVVHHVEGAGNPALNGAPIGAEPLALRDGDLIELAGTQMRFVQA